MRKIGAFEGLPAMGLDGLGSSAYGPEAALTILIPLGAASASHLSWVMLPIVALLGVLFASYWQTIRAYPNNGGAYIVAKDNLGTTASLLAAAALMIDYVLNVAVGISAGVAALVSAVPGLHPYILPLCLGILALVTLSNLRGTLDAGRIFALPTYLFVGSFALILSIGLAKAVSAGGHPEPIVSPPAFHPAVEAVSLWLLLRAFSAGCTAMTGVEAVSNGMSAFRDPPLKYGQRTLSAIVLILGCLLAGIAYLVQAYGIDAMVQTEPGYRSVLSQLASAVVGQGVIYYLAIGSLLCVLCLSANTSFVDFPRLCRMVAQDGFLPKSFAVAGRRLVFSVGILYLAACAGLLLFVFGGVTDHLIPLFAIGAFLTFTLSQSGMALHWRRILRSETAQDAARAHRFHYWINVSGASATAVALAIILVTKFAEGAWIVILTIPCVILLLKAIRRYYAEIAARVRDPQPIALDGIQPPIVLVAMEDWNKLTDQAVRLALSMSPDVIAVHLTQLSGPEEEDRNKELQTRWRHQVEQPAIRAGFLPPRLIIMQAQFRTIQDPFLKLVEELHTKFPGRRIAVLIPEIVKRHWYQHLLHTRRARRLRSQILRHGASDLTVISVPWRLDAPIEDRTDRFGQAPHSLERSSRSPG